MQMSVSEQTELANKLHDDGQAWVRSARKTQETLDKILESIDKLEKADKKLWAHLDIINAVNKALINAIKGAVSDFDGSTSKG